MEDKTYTSIEEKSIFLNDIELENIKIWILRPQKKLYFDIFYNVETLFSQRLYTLFNDGSGWIIPMPGKRRKLAKIEYAFKPAGEIKYILQEATVFSKHLPSVISSNDETGGDNIGKFLYSTDIPVYETSISLGVYTIKLSGEFLYKCYFTKREKDCKNFAFTALNCNYFDFVNNITPDDILPF